MLKDSPSEELANSIRSVMAGRRLYAPELVDDLYSESTSPLTAREKEVLALVADGKTQKKLLTNYLFRLGTVRNYFYHSGQTRSKEPH